MERFDRVAVFSATMARDRALLGEKVTRWLRTEGSSLEVVGKAVRQSSDLAFHCLSITLFMRKVV
jgi:hypothetical protein